MKKLITIEGELDVKGTKAYKLSVNAAKSGKKLSAHIDDLLTKDANKKY